MTAMIVHAGSTLDEFSHTGKRPEIGAETLRAGSLAQRRVELLKLPGGQSRFAPSPARGAQVGPASPFPEPEPATDALAANLQGPRHVGLGSTANKKAGGALAPKFQRLKISSSR